MQDYVANAHGGASMKGASVYVNCVQSGIGCATLNAELAAETKTTGTFTQDASATMTYDDGACVVTTTVGTDGSVSYVEYKFRHNIKMLLAYVVILGSVSLAPIVVADSASSRGRWDEGKVMTINHSSTSLNNGKQCLHDNCAINYKLGEQNIFSKTTDEDISVSKIINGVNRENYSSFNELDNYFDEEKLISNLLNWLNQHFSFNYLAYQRPKLKIVAASKINEIAFGSALPKVVNQKRLNVYGLYKFDEKTIYILDSIDLNTTNGKGILLHELVHYVQYQTGKEKFVNCIKELESEAYKLEASYLKENGLDIDFKYAEKCL